MGRVILACSNHESSIVRQNLLWIDASCKNRLCKNVIFGYPRAFLSGSGQVGPRPDSKTSGSGTRKTSKKRLGRARARVGLRPHPPLMFTLARTFKVFQFFFSFTVSSFETTAAVHSPGFGANPAFGSSTIGGPNELVVQQPLNVQRNRYSSTLIL